MCGCRIDEERERETVRPNPPSTFSASFSKPGGGLFVCVCASGLGSHFDWEALLLLLLLLLWLPLLLSSSLSPSVIPLSSSCCAAMVLVGPARPASETEWKSWYNPPLRNSGAVPFWLLRWRFERETDRSGRRQASRAVDFWATKARKRFLYGQKRGGRRGDSCRVHIDMVPLWDLA